MSSLWGEPQSEEPYPDLFPGFEMVDKGEAEILVGKGGVVLKIYNPEYTNEAIEYYSEVTNRLAETTAGSTISVDLKNGNEYTFNLVINPVTELGNLPDGRVFTKGKFIGGPHMEEQNSLVRKMGIVANRVHELLVSERDVTYLIRDLVEQRLMDELPEEDRVAVRIHPRNIKLICDGDILTMVVTDISCRISDLIEK